MDLHLDATQMTDADVDRLIGQWTELIPERPATVEPLFIWPNSLGITYLIRALLHRRRIRKTGWDKWYQDATNWYHAVNRDYARLFGDLSITYYPALASLRRFISDTRRTQHERTIRQREWDRLSRAEKRALKRSTQPSDA